LRQTRARWIDLFADYDARIEVVYIEPPLRMILAQNARRASPLPVKVIQELAEKREPPTITDCHRLVMVSPASGF
jgi:predicted kinase